MATITCSRCNQPGEQLKAPPLPGDLGARIYDSICQNCWRDWLRQQTAVINHYGLNLLDPKAKQFLTQQTEVFLFGATGERA
jgi:Fe-S cluster biosynthesis and repair protein YggX